MKSSVLRAPLLLALALGLSACGGGKATFPINVFMAKSPTVEGLVYTPLVLSESFSGQTLTITDTTIDKFSFANTIEYGEEYKVEVKTQPPHQTCTVGRGQDTAGRQASIDVVVACQVNDYNLAGTVTFETGRTGDVTGLQLINGSDSVPFTAIATTASYSFNDIKYNTPFSLAILRQPTDGLTTCKLVRTETSGTATVLDTTASGRIGDANIGINIVCRK